MNNRILFKILQLRKRLWARPLLFCIMAVLAAALAHLTDFVVPDDLPPQISRDTVDSLLTIISSSMLAVATFAVGSMVSAYSSAGQAATPRAFFLVLDDDVSQTALSSFIGAFIFSIVGLIALKTEFYGPAGIFAMFLLTISIFAWVILTFVRWVDNIARLGRLGSTIDKAEDAAEASIRDRLSQPYLGGVRQTEKTALKGYAVHASQIGYVQYVDVQALQQIAEAHGLHIMLAALPGTFVTHDRALVVLNHGGMIDDDLRAEIEDCFVIGNNRSFEEDPRFGLIVLSEISARALSPGVNDPGTAIVTIGRFVKLLALWTRPEDPDSPPQIKYDRLIVPEIALDEMFDDAFTAIARDGAGTVEVGIRLQKAFRSLARISYPGMRDQALRHSGLALKRARQALPLEEDYARLEAVARTI